MKRIMARACSNSLAMRLLLFYLPVLLYNLWRIVKASLAVKGGPYRNGKKLTIVLFIGHILIDSNHSLLIAASHISVNAVLKVHMGSTGIM